MEFMSKASDYMKKPSRLLPIILIWCVGIFSSCYKTDNSALRIGVLTPLTGENANYGKSTKEGIDLAIDEINNQSYLERPLIAVYEDDKMEAKDGLNAINKLIASDRVPIVIGPFGSSVVNAVAPVANQNKVIVISASATADNIKNAGDYIFRITPSNARQGVDVADFSFKNLKAKTAAVLFQLNDYGTSLKNSFEDEFTKLGGKIVATESGNSGDKDFKTQLAKIKNAKPDVIFFPLHIAEAGIFLKQAKEFGINSKFISCDGARVVDLFLIAGQAAEGTYYTAPAWGSGIPNDEKVSDFNASFKRKYGKEPDVYAAYYYEVTKLIAYAIKNSGYDGTAIKDFLYSINGDKDYKGITGTISFDRNGEVDKSFQIYIASGGKFEMVNW